jgi:hypothetical protein
LIFTTINRVYNIPDNTKNISRKFETNIKNSNKDSFDISKFFIIFN